MEPQGTLAPYGKACANCARSKCRCIIRHAAGPCERCRRLNTECRPAESVRRPRSWRKPVPSRMARLEGKLVGLVSLIKAEINQTGLAKQPTKLLKRILQPPVSALTPSTEGSAGSPYIGQSLTTEFEPSPDEAERYLIDFRTLKSKYFSFIHIPFTTRAQDLRRERPFLWLCIMLINSKLAPQQQSLTTRIRQTVAQEMVIESEKSLDLLLGILTFCWWAHRQDEIGVLSIFTQLAVSLVFDQGLNKQVRKDFRPLFCVKANFPRAPSPRTMEERRAVLGCFLVTSVISSFVQKIDALRWTLHMDECLQVLDERKECFNDEILVQQVRLQLITERANRALLDDGILESAKGHTNPAFLGLEIFQSQLLSVKNDLLAQPQTDNVVLLHLYSAELEVFLPPPFLQGTFHPRISVDPGLQAIKSWFDRFFTIPVTAYAELPFSILSQLLRCQVTLSRLISQEGSGWMENSVWTIADALSTINRVIKNLEQVAELARLDNSGSPDGDVFFRTAQILRSFRPGMGSLLIQDDLTIPSQGVGIDFDDDWLMDLMLYPNN
ncbi:Zn(II)2Cys6 transcription factor [Rhexocercosporidium sp. MPI-PUGE-AT-0058]|nr:Zn(II)2Cys6 transcription factor [Rhexocercosporidium sp. MPI-PUGE-AT-0058]